MDDDKKYDPLSEGWGHEDESPEKLEVEDEDPDTISADELAEEEDADETEEAGDSIDTM